MLDPDQSNDTAKLFSKLGVSIYATTTNIKGFSLFLTLTST